MTFLRSLHPYPAMIADELAATVAAQYIRGGYRVLDPFCGTGRTLIAAAEQGAECLGIDVNPLAILLLRAKVCKPDVAVLGQVLEHFRAEQPWKEEAYDLEPGRRVEWFSSDVRRELCGIIAYLNSLCLKPGEVGVLAAILSATARDVSFCRKKQWKLHRMEEARRTAFRKSARRVFVARLKKLMMSLAEERHPCGLVNAMIGDARDLMSIIPQEWRGKLDVIFTSPPYGDSRTTVGYGAVSSVCLGVLRNLKGFSDIYMSGGEIDRQCLGGGNGPFSHEEAKVILSTFWRGNPDSNGGTRVLRFLADLKHCCDGIAKALRPGGRAILVISRRRVDGEILLLDEFVHTALKPWELRLESSFLRGVSGKRTPLVIHRKARCKSSGRAGGRVVTMSEEHVLVFRKQGHFVGNL